ncbi:MAG: tRNA (adenosine(37)-N6)-threonylcarbamoyltransferase complex ATPase subunit type 1 TsaE [Calditrichaeota bacterium]|nr:tRNA (adenosine(37)-N6)-threonylcarbamoyltransferase complex ATPase subunit type 1 TsaE [Calditrichota bacterium]
MKILHQQISRSIEDTLKFARYLVRILKPNDIVLLEGDLGSGKTLLVKQICNLLKTKDEAASPSFAIIHQYNGPTPVNHFDFYRLHDEAELDQLGWEEMLNMGAITFIEWSQLIEKHLSEYYKVEIKFQGGDRIFVLKKYP